jgi:DNA-binding IclR family transcriptional regulator
MLELRDVSHGPVFLAVWGNRGPTVVHRLEGDYWTPGDVRVGTVFPVLSASGLVFLASFPEPRVRAIIEEPLRATAPHDPWHGMTADDVVGLLAEVRRDGYALGRGVVARGSGFVGVVAPIYDHENAVAAAFVINATATSTGTVADPAAIDALVAAARRVSWEIGHHDAAPAPAQQRKVV